MTITREVRQIEIFGHSIRVSVRRTGHGTPLLLFNGIGSNLELLQPFIESLGDIETVVFDIPGVGASSEPLLPYRLFNMARLADQLMTKLGYEGEFDVFGVSWGRALAQQFAFQYRRRCRKLVLAATSQGVLMVPGRFRSMLKMLSARRLGDPDHLSKIGPRTLWRRNASPAGPPCRTCQSTTIAQRSRLPVPDAVRMGLDQPLVATLAAATHARTRRHRRPCHAFGQCQADDFADPKRSVARCR